MTHLLPRVTQAKISLHAIPPVTVGVSNGELVAGLGIKAQRVVERKLKWEPVLRGKMRDNKKLENRT